MLKFFLQHFKKMLVKKYSKVIKKIKKIKTPGIFGT
jgi:hypothetical protein